MKMCNM